MNQYTRNQFIRQRFLMIKHHQDGMPVTLISATFKVSRTTFYKWLNRYLEEDKSGLLDRSRRPKSHPKSLSPYVVKRIKVMRLKTNYGPKRIKYWLKERYNLEVSEHGIYKALLREGLIQRHRKRRKKDHILYSLPNPGDRLQVDTKYLDCFPGRPYRQYQYTAIDDCTRVRVIRIYDDLSIYHSLKFLREVVKRLPFGVKEIQTDNGVEFSPTNPFNFKDGHPFTLECERLGINHRLNKPGCPEANGKVERSHRIDEEEYYRTNNFKNEKERQTKLKKYLFFYNHQRPHMAIDDLTPFQKLKTFRGFENVKDV